MNLGYRVELSQSERDELNALLSGGRHSVRKLKRAQILLAADAGASDDQIATTVRVSGSTIYRTKRRFVEANLEGALSEEPRPGAERKLGAIAKCRRSQDQMDVHHRQGTRKTQESLSRQRVVITAQRY
jgi:transposase